MRAYVPGMEAELKERISIANADIGVRLSTARKAAGKTLDDLALAMGVTRATVGHWETGRNGIGAAQLREAAKLMKVTADWLLYGEKSPAALNAMELQLVTLFRGLSPESRDKVLLEANFLHNRDHPGAGPGNPFPNAPQR